MPFVLRRVAALPLGATLILPVSGCAPFPDSAWDQLDAAKQDYRNHAYGAATRKLDAILEAHPNHPDAAEAYYVRSLCHARRADKVRAEADARRCIRLAGGGEVAADAHATLATLLFEANRTKEALTHYAAALRSGRRRAGEDLLRYRYGLCLIREGRWKEARAALAEVVRSFPNGTSAQHARRLYEWPHDAYSIQCGAFREVGAASKLNEKLKRAGLRSRVESRKRSGETLHTVYVGEYGRYAQARDALPAVQRHVADAYIMPQ